MIGDKEKYPRPSALKKMSFKCLDSLGESCGDDCASSDPAFPKKGRSHPRMGHKSSSVESKDPFYKSKCI